MGFIKIALLSLSFLFVASISSADEPDVDFADGNLIAEPTLDDYMTADRAPGILVEPYDIIEAE